MWSRIKSSLSKTSHSLSQGLAALFQGSTLTPQQWDDVTDALIMADLGANTVETLMTYVQNLGPMSAEDLRQKVLDYIVHLLVPHEKILQPAPIVMAVGVNGSGKTTTLGKLGWKWRQQGHRLHFIAADTFRAAAVEQLAFWAKQGTITTGGKDPASTVFRGLQEAKENDIVLIDTAGRLPNKVGLMEELKKVYSVIQRQRPCDQCEIILVLDATLGQHTLTQVETFQKCVPLSGLIINKMEGTAKGGILVNIAQTFDLPIYGLGTGEKPEDFEDFQALPFTQGLLGV
jgi:fused signal recognition particle receptor